MLHKKTLLLFVAISLSFVAIRGVNAVEIRLDASKVEVRIGEQFVVTVFMSADESVNAVEGQLVFPPDWLSVKDIHDGNSVINFWIEKPHIDTSGVVLFSGITSGGFTGSNNRIFSVVFEAKKTGIASVVLQNTKALLNDGLGTPTEVRIKNSELKIQESGDLYSKSYILSPPPDTEPPEIFRPEIAKGSEMFDGKWFLVFATQDKGSGIDHYEIREVKRRLYLLPVVNYIYRNSWTEAESPYILKDQKLRSWIYVKATDKIGNERVAIVEPRYPMKWYAQPLVWIIIVIAGIVGYFIKKFRI